MKTWIKAAAMCTALAGCAAPLYREEFNVAAVYEAYTHYRVVAQNPFDQTKADPDLTAALESYLADSALVPAGPDQGLERQVLFALSTDVEASRRRVLALAANDVRNWVYQLKRNASPTDLVAIEVYERQTGNMIYRAEAFRLDNDGATMKALLSGFPPSAQRTTRLRGQLQ